MVQGGIKFRISTGGSKLDSRLEGKRGWFTIVHVKAMKKVTSILRLGKKKFLHWFAKLGGQGNSAKSLSLSF
jgi:hypothetical protein